LQSDKQLKLRTCIAYYKNTELSRKKARKEDDNELSSFLGQQFTYSVNIMVDYIQADVFTSVEGWLLLLLLIILLLLETSTLYFVAFV
jgi:hypothetical protein